MESLSRVSRVRWRSHAPGIVNSSSGIGRVPTLRTQSVCHGSAARRTLQRPARRLKGVIVLIRGAVASETYFNDADAGASHYVRSAGKSITSLLVGIAVDRGIVASVDEPIFSLLAGEPGPSRAQVMLKHILTMRSGLAADDEDPDSPGNENLLDASSDGLALGLKVPMLRHNNTQKTGSFKSPVFSLDRLRSFGEGHLFEFPEVGRAARLLIQYLGDLCILRFAVFSQRGRIRTESMLVPVTSLRRVYCPG